MQILPLLGLLGTVWGMVQVFEIMTVFGTGNARLMAGGVSQATIPTMSGLVAALSGLYLSAWLRQRAKRKMEELEDALEMQFEEPLEAGRMIERKHRKRSQEEAEINITPMLDIVFIMLIFFIVTTSFVKELGVDLDRPSNAPVKEQKRSEGDSGPH